MAKKPQLAERFMELRLSGKTYQAISEELGVSKQSLIEWSKDKKISEALDFGKLVRFQELIRKYQLHREASISRYAEIVNKCMEELEGRDLTNLSTEKLVKMLLLLHKKLEEGIPEPQIFKDPPFFSAGLDSQNSFSFDILD